MSVMRVVTSRRNLTRSMLVDDALRVNAGVSVSSTAVTDFVTMVFSVLGMMVYVVDCEFKLERVTALVSE